MRRTIIVIIAVVALGIFGWRLFNLITAKLSNSANRMSRPPVAVQVTEVTRSSIREIRQFTGTVEPQYRYIVAPKVSGRIVKIVKRIGDPVRKGEEIARLDDAEYQQAVLEAEANLKIAEASLTEIQGQAELAKQELDRARSLRDKGISSTAELDAAVSNNTAQQSRLKLAAAQVEQREAALNSARIRLGYTILNASEPGFVGERFVDEGALLAPNTPVISVVGIDRVIIGTTIVERDYGRIKIGQESTVMVDAFANERFTGNVSRIAPMLQESSRVAKMEIEVVNTNRILKPGMFARVNVVLESRDSALVVPAQAIVSSRGGKQGSGVFMVEAGERPVAKFVPVETGIVTSDLVEIMSPPLSGLVVTLGQHLLSDGSPLILPGKGKEGGKPGSGGKKAQGGPGKEPGK